MNTIARNIGAALGGQVAGSIVAGHVLATGLPADSGFELAFLVARRAPPSPRCRCC